MLNSAAYDAKPMTPSLGGVLTLQVEEFNLLSSTNLSRRTGCPDNYSTRINLRMTDCDCILMI
jgi:hypothetical protein